MAGPVLTPADWRAAQGRLASPAPAPVPRSPRRRGLPGSIAAILAQLDIRLGGA